MHRFWLASIALFALTAKAQNIEFANVQHIHTAMNHLTVIDMGEPIQFIATADPDSFQIERAGDKVLLQPLKDSASTNLILWTASRHVSYELDAPGDVQKMDVLIRDLPAPVHAASGSLTEKEREQIASNATAEAMLDAQDVVGDQSSRSSSNAVTASIVRVLHTDGGTYLQYEIVNHSNTPFRVTTPSITQLSPTQTPVSLTALRNHELSPQTVSSFRTKAGTAPAVIGGQSQQSDVQPGGSTGGYVLVRTPGNSLPGVYQLDFGSTPAGPLVQTVVI